MIWFFGVSYCVAMTAVSLVAMVKTSWLYKLTEQKIEFRKPYVLRTCTAMTGLFSLIVGVALPADQVASRQDYAAWYFFFPLCLFMAVLLVFASGPQDVYIDVKSRTGYGTFGWPFPLRRRNFALLNTSFLCIYPAGRSGYIAYLCIGNQTDLGDKKLRFRLGMGMTKNNALSLVSDVNRYLHLSIKELTAKEMLRIG